MNLSGLASGLLLTNFPVNGMKITHWSKKFLPLLAIAILSFEVSADPNGFNVKTLTRSEWKFPVVAGPKAEVAERINYLMLVKAFDLELPLIPPENPAQSLTVLTEDYSRSIASMDYSVLRNDERIFSVLFDAEGCGAYCESFQRPLAFDAESGRLLTDLDLFTDAGRQALIVEIAKRNRKAIQDQIKKLQETEPSKAEHPEDIDTAIAMYKECLSRWQSKAWHNWIGSMEFHPAELIFVDGRCSNHALLALDELGDLRNSFTYDALKQWLSAYGRRVLLGEKSDGKPASAIGQWLKGTIGGKTRISLYLDKPYGELLGKDTEIHGYYYYDRYRKPLHLRGKWQDGKFHLQEFDLKETPQATLTLKNDGKGGLQGQWKSGNSKKLLRVKLDP